MNFRPIGILPFLIPVLWLGYKWILFRDGVYAVDVHAHTQLCISWLDGRPFLTDTVYGNHFLLHNYFLNPLLAPFVYGAGSLGLFGLHTVLCLVALFLWRQDLAGRGGRTWLAVSALLVGPLGYWVFCDLTQGWHVELLYLPLAACWASAWHRRSSASLFAATLAIALVKENAPVLLCALFLFASFPDKDRSSLIRNLATRSNGWILLAFTLLFAAGLIWLSALNGWGHSRLGLAIQAVRRHPEALGSYLIRSLTGNLAILAGGLVPFLLLAISTTRKKQYLLLVTLLALPLILSNIVEGLAYYPYSRNAFGFPPRTAFLWGFLAPAHFLAAARYGYDLKFRFPFPATTVVQLAALAVIAEPRIWPVLTGLYPRYTLSKEQESALEAASRSLPSHSEVICDLRVLPFFHQHYVSALTDTLQTDRQPDLWVYSEKSTGNPCKNQQKYQQIQANGLVFLWKKRK